MIKAIMSISLFSGLSKTAKAMCKSLIYIYLFLLAIGLLFIFFIYPFEKPLPYSLGLSIGILCSALKILLMEKSISHSMELDKGTAKNYAGVMSVLRYFLTIGVFLLVIFIKDIFGLFGTIAGVLALQAAAFAAHLMTKHLTASQL